MAVQDVKAAEKRFQDGIEAAQDGKLDAAIEAFSDAEIRFRLAGDFKRAGDSRALMADAQRQSAMLEQAANSCQKAIKLYRQANRPLNEAGATLALGHIERQQAHLDSAQEAYQQAWHLYVTLDNTLGLGNVTLALGHIEMQRGRMTAPTRPTRAAAWPMCSDSRDASTKPSPNTSACWRPTAPAGIASAWWMRSSDWGASTSINCASMTPRQPMQRPSRWRAPSNTSWARPTAIWDWRNSPCCATALTRHWQARNWRNKSIPLCIMR